MFMCNLEPLGYPKYGVSMELTVSNYIEGFTLSSDWLWPESLQVGALILPFLTCEVLQGCGPATL